MFAQLLKQISQLSEEDKCCIVHWIRQHYRVDWFRNLITKIQQFISVRQLPPDPTELPPTSKGTWWVSSATVVLSLLCELRLTVKGVSWQWALVIQFYFGRWSQLAWASSSCLPWGVLQHYTWPHWSNVWLQLLAVLTESSYSVSWREMLSQKWHNYALCNILIAGDFHSVSILLFWAWPQRWQYWNRIRNDKCWSWQRYFDNSDHCVALVCNQPLIASQRSLQEKVLQNETPEADNLFLNLTIRRAHIVEDSINEVGCIHVVLLHEFQLLV